MTDRDLIGEKVVSKFYGEGEIIDVFENKVEIQFAEKQVFFLATSLQSLLLPSRRKCRNIFWKK